MGDIKKPKKKYDKPSHPWEKTRIEEEKVLRREFGLKNKKEIWKMVSVLKKYTSQAKKLTGLRTAQSDVERKQLMDKLASYGLVAAGAQLSEILGLSVRDIMERRLQTVLVRKGLARTMKQARQMIVHRHVLVGGKNVSVPSFLVRKGDEAQIEFVVRSPFIREDHPERAVAAAEPARAAPPVEATEESKAVASK